MKVFVTVVVTAIDQVRLRIDAMLSAYLPCMISAVQMVVKFFFVFRWTSYCRKMSIFCCWFFLTLDSRASTPLNWLHCLLSSSISCLMYFSPSRLLFLCVFVAFSTLLLILDYLASSSLLFSSSFVPHLYVSSIPFPFLHILTLRNFRRCLTISAISRAINKVNVTTRVDKPHKNRLSLQSNIRPIWQVNTFANL